MNSLAREKRLAMNPQAPAGNHDGARSEVDEEEPRFFRRMAKIARRTTTKEIDRLFGPAE